MKFGFACSVKGIRPDAHRTAREAARQAGLPMNDWLNAVILQQAATQGIKMFSPARAGGEESAHHLSEVHLRLDDLAHRIDQMTHGAFAHYAPKRSREEADQFSELFARLEQRFDQLAANISSPPAPPAIPSTHASTLDRAMAEIAMLRSLNGETRPAPVQDLTNLEDRLRRITDQIETLRRPGVEEAIAALRAELGEIGRTLNEAMPRRAIESIERQIQGLSQRIAEERQAGVDNSALAGIEYGLAEVRDALRELTPAENLAGYTEAIYALAQKIDLIVDQRDPVTMEQLEKSIWTLREMATHAASNETMSGLSAQVQTLADKIDHLAIGGGASDAFNKLELRIDALSRAVSESAQNGDTISPRLETLIQSLSEKTEQIQQSRGDQLAAGVLEDRIAKLVERLDATGSRLNHLDAIERGLADLLVHIEEIRSNKETAALRAGSAPSVDVLKLDMTRTQDALAAMHGTLDRVADRLAVIEKDIRRDRSAVSESGILELTQLAEIAVKAVPDTTPQLPSIIELQTPIPPTAPDHAAFAPESSFSVPTETTNWGAWPNGAAASATSPEVDQPLEPGSGRPGFGIHPSLRIAASEAALGAARPSAATQGSKSSFIAAARRAAQTAGQDPKSRPTRSEPFKASGSENVPTRPNVLKRAKLVLLAASIVAIIVGSIQLTSNIFNFGIFDTNDAKVANNLEPDGDDGAGQNAVSETTASIADNQQDARVKTDDITATLLAPPTLPSLTPAISESKVGAIDGPPSFMRETSPASNPQLPALNPLLNAPVLTAPSGSKSDVTGLVARAPADVATNSHPAPAAQPQAAEGLPAAIGGVRLRNAAIAGDPAAAYEVAMRFMEGRGVPANLEEAARWYERAASKGLGPAQFRYASMLEKGQGVRKDLGVARKLYIAAATKGHAKAMHNLAVLYAEGAEGKPDYANAALWFRKAAEHGVADSQYNLGVLTARGLGTDKNIAESYKWFALAAAQGDKDADRKRDDVASNLDAQALASAQEAVKSFAAQSQPAVATVVPEPPGGWDRTTPAPHEKPRAGGPLSISANGAGKP